jgi:hypothetical protein
LEKREENREKEIKFIILEEAGREGKKERRGLYEKRNYSLLGQDIIASEKI